MAVQTAEPSTFDFGDIVKVTNVGPRPFTIGYNGKQYELQPDRESYIPVEAAILWFGDPRSAGTTQALRLESGAVAVIPDRESEVRRLLVKYGHLEGNGNEFLQNKDNSTPVPRVKLYTTNGDELKTVLEDPNGESVTPAVTTVAQQQDLRAIIDAQQRQIDSLRKLFEKMGGSAAQVEVPETHELPEDDSHLQGHREPSLDDLTGGSGIPGPDLDLNP